jgi:hypothetical protein
MKRMIPFYWFSKLFAGDGKARKLQLLWEQCQILCNGVEASAEVINACSQNDVVGNLVEIKLMLKLKKTDGSYVYTNTATLVSLRQLPGKGDLLHIKYIPGCMQTVVIL